MAALEVLALNTVIPQIQAPQVGDTYLFPRAAEFSAGTQLLPSLAATGDLDTGMWFPAANTVAWSTGAFERLRIDSSGNVGIGTTSPSGRFHIASSGDTLSIIDARTGAPNGSFAILQLWSKNAAGTNNFGRLAFDGDGNLEIGTYGSGASANEIAFFLNSQERMRIDSSGNVGIGTTSPAVRLEVAGQIRTEAPTGGTAANWRLGTVHTVSPTSPNRTIEVDIGGTIYYLHAKTTNN